MAESIILPRGRRRGTAQFIDVCGLWPDPQRNRPAPWVYQTETV